MNKDMTKRGVTLIEILIYLPLSMMICLIAMHLTLSLIRFSIIQSKDFTNIVDLHSALDLMRSDLLYSLKNNIKENELVIAMNNTNHKNDIGWLVDKNKLYRSVGKFNYKKKEWYSKKNYIMANNIEKNFFVFDKENNCMKIKIYYFRNKKNEQESKLINICMRMGINDY